MPLGLDAFRLKTFFNAYALPGIVDDDPEGVVIDDDFEIGGHEYEINAAKSELRKIQEQVDEFPHEPSIAPQRLRSVFEGVVYAIPVIQRLFPQFFAQKR